MVKVPQIVKDAAQDLIDQFGDNFIYLGMFEGADAYIQQVPDDLCIGYPHVYLVKDGKVDDISGPIALFIIESLIKDLDEVGSE